MNTETIEEVKLDEKIERTVIDPGKYNVVFLNDNQTAKMARAKLAFQRAFSLFTEKAFQ